MHQCIRPLGGVVVPRAIMDINALRSHYRTDFSGPFGHQCSQAPGRPILHLVSSSRRPRREADYVNSGSSSSAERSLGGCRKDPPRLEVAPMGEDAPGDASQLVGERDRQHVVMQAPSIRSSSRRQSPARSSMTRAMRGDRTSQRVARMPGNSARRKRSPCRTATPRSKRKARI